MLAASNSTISFVFDVPVIGFAADWTGSESSVGDNALDVTMNGRSLIPFNNAGVDDGLMDLLTLQVNQSSFSARILRPLNFGVANVRLSGFRDQL